MNKNKNLTNHISPDIFQKIKKSNYPAFCKFCTELYKTAYKDGQDSVKGIEVEEILKEISDIKGIGEVKAAKIREAIDEKLKSV